MEALKAYFLCILVTLSSNIHPASSSSSSSSSSQSIKGAYWPSWASDFPPSVIDTSLFTHIYYAFLTPNNVTFKFDVSNSTAILLKSFTSILRAKNPPVKMLFSVGADEGPILFSRMTSSASSRKNFINSTIEVARKFGFDGIDLDWELPQNPTDMQNLGYLLDEWQGRGPKGSPGHTLVSTLAHRSRVLFRGCLPPRDLQIISRGLMTGAHAALFDPKSNLSTSYGLGSWIKAGMPRSKLIIGLPLYGRTWKLKDPRSHDVGSAAVGLGPGDSQGIMSFFQVQIYNKENNAKVEHDMDTVSTYSVVGTSWIGYDDTKSKSIKIGYAQALGLRGYFFWAVNGDYEWKMSKQASSLWILDSL
ncbi:hypothetical protein F0562_030301 [Nyssa sinensis]|uniref:GH18 domain-containing protein n=1 Tax=Nyssa sinensis TaxID=561372 RepID=A0A5J5AYI3_9ASTE|nr:hypothetical protein F0562_030301 [Nyssa sinensis]